MGLGFVQINVVDNGGGAVVVPANSVQVVAGVSESGPTNAVLSTRSLQTLLSTYGNGPLIEAASLAIQAGGTVLTVRLPTTTAGSSTAVVITRIATSTSVVTISGSAKDTADVFFKVIAGGTIGINGITFQVSYDAGRTFGPILALLAANTYVLTRLGITLHFAAGTLDAGDIAKFSTVEPLWSKTDLQTAMNLLFGSPFAPIGWGSMHIVGGSDTAASGGVIGADVATIEGYFDTWATNFLFSRTYMSARDAHAPIAFGGAGETEAAWMASLEGDFASTNAKRISVGAAYWNMPSAFPDAQAGTPRFRRSISYAAAARQVSPQVQPVTHIGKVKLGPLSQIVVDTTSDPLDGFIYHDERVNPGLDYIIAGSGGRFMSTLTRPGYGANPFISNPLTMATLGSDFFIMPRGLVMDLACDITVLAGQQFIDDDVRVNTNGTINTNDAAGIESAIGNQLKNALLATSQISDYTVTVDLSWNVLANNTVKILVQIEARGVILGEIVTIQYTSPFAG